MGNCPRTLLYWRAMHLATGTLARFVRDRMETDRTEYQYDEVEAESVVSDWAFGWGVMLAVGWFVFELTAQPRFGIAATCTKLMWNDIKTGLWWLKRDPWRQRGICGMTLLVIRATAKYAFTLIAIGCVMSGLVEREEKLEDTTFAFTVLTGGFALAFWMVSGFFITILCVMGGVRLWIDGSLQQSRKRDVFPPECRGRNQSAWLLLGTRLGEIIVGACVLAMIAEKLNLNVPGGIALIVCGSIPLLAVQLLISRRIIATAPSQCWSGGSAVEGERAALERQVLGGEVDDQSFSECSG